MIVPCLFLAGVALSSPLKDVHLIETSPSEKRCKTESKVLELTQKCISFMNITDYGDLSSASFD